ncbi:MAG: glycoside hydrolase family 15 protein [Propionibacteriaceae bacterium]|nr:glycoside hydrolase family 15 protein [Propionibacteriaceae bacterium]
MSTPIEDYALLADLHTAPLVSREGSIDWLCFPRFDSAAVFSALLGEPDDGRWKLSIAGGEVVDRRYVGRSFVLETLWQTPDGLARVTDFLPPSTDHADLIRRVECVEGSVTVEHDLVMRFEYGTRTPWTRRVDLGGGPSVVAVAGPNALQLTGPLLTPVDEDDAHAADREGAPTGHLAGSFDLAEGEQACWTLTWWPSYRPHPEPADVDRALDETLASWSEWAGQVCAPDGAAHPHEDAVIRSLLVLRALTHSDTGGIVAAATTSLPEEFGGSRNWDYRFTWLRDAAFTIEAMIGHGYLDGAHLWRNWLLRAIAGEPDDVRIMYGIGGEKHLPEEELDHLAGYEGSRPVRIGNGAADQYQADVAGEVMLALAALRKAGGTESEHSWGMQKNLLRFCIRNIDRPDHGIWEMRGDLHHFTHGRVMMWAAFDRGVRAVEEDGLDGDVEAWREYRERLHAEIWERGFDADRNTFTQTYDNSEVDASLLQLPQTGFIAYDDPAMLGTVAAIEEDLQGPDGLIHRYRTEAGVDGLEGDEYPFLICAFWLVEQYARSGRRDDADALMATLLGCANDLGLLAEEFDPTSGRLAGNFPQAFSHLGLIRAADALAAPHVERDGQVERNGQEPNREERNGQTGPDEPAG